MWREPRQRDKAYLSWLHELPCVVTGRMGDGVQAAHIRFASIEYGKRYTGGAEKPHDRFCLPLWWQEHATQHEGERRYWRERGIDPLWLCHLLWRIYPDVPKAQFAIFSQIRRRQ